MLGSRPEDGGKQLYFFFKYNVASKMDAKTLHLSTVVELK